MFYALALLVAFADLTATAPPKASAFDSPEWVAAEREGFAGNYFFYFALYRDGTAVYKDTDGNLAQVRLDAVDRRALFRDFTVEKFNQLPAGTPGHCDDCADYRIFHWSNGVRRLVATENAHSPAAFWAFYRRLRSFHSHHAKVLKYAWVEVRIRAEGLPPHPPLPSAWPKTLPALLYRYEEYTAVLDHTQLRAAREFAKHLDPKKWRFGENPYTPAAPHEEMWTDGRNQGSSPGRLDGATQMR